MSAKIEILVELINSIRSKIATNEASQDDVQKLPKLLEELTLLQSDKKTLLKG